jgi:hypothetical protein
LNRRSRHSIHYRLTRSPYPRRVAYRLSNNLRILSRLHVNRHHSRLLYRFPNFLSLNFIIIEQTNMNDILPS